MAIAIKQRKHISANLQNPAPKKVLERVLQPSLETPFEMCYGLPQTSELLRDMLISLGDTRV